MVDRPAHLPRLLQLSCLAWATRYQLKARGYHFAPGDFACTGLARPGCMDIVAHIGYSER